MAVEMLYPVAGLIKTAPPCPQFEIADRARVWNHRLPVSAGYRCPALNPG